MTNLTYFSQCIYFIPLHVSSNKCSSSGGSNCVNTSSSIIHSSGWLSCVPTGTQDSHFGIISRLSAIRSRNRGWISARNKRLFSTDSRTPLTPIRVAKGYRGHFTTRYSAWAWGWLLNSYCQVEEYVELYSHSSLLLCGIYHIIHKENVIHCFYRRYFPAGKADRLIS
jgi:hypothetical protein